MRHWSVASLQHFLRRGFKTKVETTKNSLPLNFLRRPSVHKTRSEQPENTQTLSHPTRTYTDVSLLAVLMSGGGWRSHLATCVFSANSLLQTTPPLLKFTTVKENSVLGYEISFFSILKTYMTQTSSFSEHSVNTGLGLWSGKNNHTKQPRHELTMRVLSLKSNT